MPPESNQNSKAVFWSSVIIALVWPITILVIFCSLKMPIHDVLTRFSEVGYGNFYVRVKQVAEQQGMPEAAQSLQGLTYDALQAFLVIGGEYGDETAYRPPLSHYRQMRIYEELQARGLIELIKVHEIPETTDKGIEFQTTDRGRKMHKILLDSIYGALITMEHLH